MGIEYFGMSLVVINNHITWIVLDDSARFLFVFGPYEFIDIGAVFSHVVFVVPYAVVLECQVHRSVTVFECAFPVVSLSFKGKVYHSFSVKEYISFEVDISGFVFFFGYRDGTAFGFNGCFVVFHAEGEVMYGGRCSLFADDSVFVCGHVGRIKGDGSLFVP